jgi:hypothetical protein
VQPRGAPVARQRARIYPVSAFGSPPRLSYARWANRRPRRDLRSEQSEAEGRRLRGEERRSAVVLRRPTFAPDATRRIYHRASGSAECLTEVTRRSARRPALDAGVCLWNRSGHDSASPRHGWPCLVNEVGGTSDERAGRPDQERPGQPSATDSDSKAANVLPSELRINVELVNVGLGPALRATYGGSFIAFGSPPGRVRLGNRVGLTRLPLASALPPSAFACAAQQPVRRHAPPRSDCHLPQITHHGRSLRRLDGEAEMEPPPALAQERLRGRAPSKASD